MNTSRNIRLMLLAFLLLFALLAGYLVYIIGAYGDYWFASPYNTRVSAQKSRVTAGDILDRSGEVLVSTDDDGTREYIDDEDTAYSIAHIVGDNCGYTIGAQSLFAKYLLGFESGIGAKLDSLLTGEKRRGNNVELTIDAALSRYAYETLDGMDGAVIVMNYKTGEVLCAVSSPSFSLENMAQYASGEYTPEDGSLVNRATMGRYTPGSTFKIVTAIAALRYLPNARTRTFSCDGEIVFETDSGRLVEDEATAYGADGELLDGYSVLRDFDAEVHGDLTLEQAFACSCNNVFAKIALEIGEDKLKKTAESLGLNGEFMFDELVVYSGNYPESNTDFELAWSGIGQHTDIMTPMHMCMLSCAIANGGVIMEPKLMREVIDTNGNVLKSLKSETYKTWLLPDEAEFLKECMRLTVKEGTGAAAAVSGLTVCGKTGTAEVSSNKDIKPHAWFTGFIEDESDPYAVCIVIENGGGGGTAAAPAASKILSETVRLMKLWNNTQAADQPSCRSF